ncbi:hypothetical protein OF83DRAFT_1171336 [Amylostereum chailletii]|nr:hypothetical protein OF83DRAFT_1171336 [Amylostereum chailletii]
MASDSEETDLGSWAEGDADGDAIDEELPEGVVEDIPPLTKAEEAWVTRHVREFRAVKWANRPAWLSERMGTFYVEVHNGRYYQPDRLPTKKKAPHFYERCTSFI